MKMKLTYGFYLVSILLYLSGVFIASLEILNVIGLLMFLITLFLDIILKVSDYEERTQRLENKIDEFVLKFRIKDDNTIVPNVPIPLEVDEEKVLEEEYENENEKVKQFIEKQKANEKEFQQLERLGEIINLEKKLKELKIKELKKKDKL